MANNSPDDIIFQILLRLPVKSLLRFKCVCKSWRSLIKDPQFIKLHRDMSKSGVNRHKIFLIGGECDNEDEFFYSVDSPLQQNSVVSLLELPIPEINPLNRVCFTSSFTNGILLLVFPCDLIVLWNPTIRKSREIPSPILNKLEQLEFPATYGFGYDSSTDDYKIVRIGKKSTSAGYYDVDIFSTKSDTWKLIYNFPPSHAFFKDVVTIDGIVYMVAITDLSMYPGEYTILSFCLEKEEFKEVPFPGQVHIFQDPVLHVLGENLCLTKLDNTLSRNFEVWCMKNNTWSRILTIPSMHCGCCVKPVGFTKVNGDIMFLRYKGDFVIYNSERRDFEIVEVAGLEVPFYFNWVIPYTESLVSPANSESQEDGSTSTNEEQ